jgi:hypothetical protein
MLQPGAGPETDEAAGKIQHTMLPGKPPPDTQWASGT